jgi:hypothetical protein
MRRPSLKYEQTEIIPLGVSYQANSCDSLREARSLISYRHMHPVFSSHLGGLRFGPRYFVEAIKRRVCRHLGLTRV